MQRSKIFDKFGKTSTGLQFSFSFLDSFLQIGLISVCFSFTGKTPLFTALRKLAEIKYEKSSSLSFIIFVGISPCCVALNVSKLFMILHKHSGLIKSKEKLLGVPMFSRIRGESHQFSYVMHHNDKNEMSLPPS